MALPCDGVCPVKLPLPERKKLVYECLIPIRWGDLDAMGHVNNTVYFRYMETARIEWFDAIGVKTDPHGVGPVIVNAFCNFHRSFTDRKSTRLNSSHT